MFKLIANLLYVEVSAARGWRRHEDTVGRAGNIFLGAVDADVGFHPVVIRRDVLIAERPVVAHAVHRAHFEIHRSKAQSNPSPVIGASPNDARAKPSEFGSRSRGIRLAVNFPETVRRQKFVVQLMPVLASDAHSAMRQVVGPQVLFVILFRIQRRTSFQHDDAQPAFRQHLRCSAATGTGSNDADVVLLGRSNYLRHGAPSNPGIILNVGRALPPA